jgi:hypothetical protein
VSGWAGARLLTPADLSVPGWVVAAGPSARPGPGRGVADGEPFESDEVRCVVSVLPAVEAADLTWIAPEHREYVASEMTAFIGHWLATLGERCLVPPSHASLAGPCPPASAWAQAAGLPLAPADGDGRRVVVSVVGGRVLGSDAIGLLTTSRLRHMATELDVPLLTAVLEYDDARPSLRAVLPAPLMGNAEVRAAVRDLVAARLAGRQDGRVAS